MPVPAFRSLTALVALSALVLPLASADLSQPMPPVSLTAQPSTDGVLLTWLPPPVSPAQVTGYNIYRSDGVEVVPVDSVGADQTTYFDVQPPGDYVYTYFVTSQSADAESAPSNPSFAGYPHCMDFTDSDCVLPLPTGPLVDGGIIHP